MTEEWRDITGYEGYYQVSDLGRVRSVSRIIVNSLGRTQHRKGRVLRASPNADGYPRVGLSQASVVKDAYVHALVAMAFLPPPAPGEEVCHYDGDPGHNVVSNLRWGTRTENLLDAVRHGTHFQAKKTHCPRGHALTPDNLAPSSLPRRQCLACTRKTGS